MYRLCRIATKKSWLRWLKVAGEQKLKLCTFMDMNFWESTWQPKLCKPITSSIVDYQAFMHSNLAKKSCILGNKTPVIPIFLPAHYPLSRWVGYDGLLFVASTAIQHVGTRLCLFSISSTMSFFHFFGIYAQF